MRIYTGEDDTECPHCHGTKYQLGIVGIPCRLCGGTGKSRSFLKQHRENNMRKRNIGREVVGVVLLGLIVASMLGCAWAEKKASDWIIERTVEKTADKVEEFGDKLAEISKKIDLSKVDEILEGQKEIGDAVGKKNNLPLGMELDTNGDGAIDMNEMTAAVARAMPVIMADNMRELRKDIQDGKDWKVAVPDRGLTTAQQGIGYLVATLMAWFAAKQSAKGKFKTLFKDMANVKEDAA